MAGRVLPRLMLGLGLLGDGVLLVFLIAMSGYVFGGPEGMRGDASAVLVWSAGVFAVVAAALAAIVLSLRGRLQQAALVAMGPPVAAMLAALASL